MMLRATVEFLLGTYRADPDGTAQTGRLARGEWPPAPSRLFDAFVAADGTGQQCRFTDGTELEVLEAAPSPSIEATTDVHHQAMNSRYVVVGDHDLAFAKKKNQPRRVKTHQEFVGRVGNKVWPGVRVTPRIPIVRYMWAVEVEAEHLRALQVRAARIGYLGCADSPVRVRIEQLPDEASLEAEIYEPDSDGELAIGVPTAGRLEALDFAFAKWTKHGTSVGRSQFLALATKTGYRAPRSDNREIAGGRVIATLTLRPGVSGRRVGAVAATFKAAVLRRFEDTQGQEPPQVLHGHGFENDDYDLARFLPLPDVGHLHARGRILGVSLWLPPGCSDALATSVRDVVHSIRRLDGAGIHVSTEVWQGQRRPAAVSTRRWIGPSRRWVTAFPAVYERHVSLTLDEVGRWCEHAGLPRPVAVRSSRVPLVVGCVSLTPSEVHRPSLPRRPYSHLELLFDQLIHGPVVVGSARQRGLGLCFPVGDRSALPRPSQLS